jgi:hypothetical protein
MIHGPSATGGAGTGSLDLDATDALIRSERGTTPARGTSDATAHESRDGIDFH